MAKRIRGDDERRFLSKVHERPDGCWIWVGGRRSNGYADFSVGAHGHVRAHRWSYERWVGPIPDGLEIDHLCRVRACVNPDHLEPVTGAENNRRAPGCQPKARCKNGHPFDEENTYIRKDRNKRECRACRREAWARWLLRSSTAQEK